MPNIGQVLRDEIARISRRECRKQSSVLQRASAAYRRDIAALKREIATMRREMKKTAASKSAAVQAPPAEGKLRFRADGFRTLRQRLGLSAAQLGKLLGVSEQSVYNWEAKTATPRSSHLPAIARLRSMGKREAQQLLDGAG
jgi:DNA-binding transcriptional regulator YiaG